MSTLKVGDVVAKCTTRAKDVKDGEKLPVYGVSNQDGITITGNVTSRDRENYIYVEENYFAYNPYRINVGSIGVVPKGVRGLVSPAYVVFKVDESKFKSDLLFRYLKSFAGIQAIRKQARGTVRQALRYEDLCEIEIPNLNSKEQEKLNLKVVNTNQEFLQLSSEFATQQSLLKKLRQQILQDAVQGELLPQNKNDEPASELLKRIKAEKEQLIADGKLRKEKPLPPIKEEEIPFKIPKNWVWCRLGEIRDFEYPLSYGVLVPGNDVPNGVPFVRVQDLDSFEANILPNKKISKLIDDQYKRTKLVGGEILICVVGSIGKIALTPIAWIGANIARAVCRFMPNKSLDQKFLFYYLNSPFIQNYFQKGYKSINPTLNVNVLEKSIVPLPPLLEQQRIVAKVEQLLQQCKELEKIIGQNQKYAEQLQQAVLQEAFTHKN